MEGKLLGVAVMLTLVGAVSCAYGPLAPEPEARLAITLCRDRTIHTKPFDYSTVSMGDTENIVHVPADDNLWIGDDHSRAAFEFDRRTGHYRSRVTARDIVEAFPEVLGCDDGDGNPETQCSYTNELEGVAYDSASGTLFIFNTVNVAYLDPPVDKPAVFRLRKKRGRGPFQLVDWRELPPGRKYGPAVVIDGRLYLAVERDLFEYDVERNRLVDGDDPGSPRPVLSAAIEGHIVGMAFDGSSLWLLTNREKLVRVDWNAKTVMESYDVAPFGVSKAKGLGFGAGEFFVVDGNAPNLIQVLRFGTAQRMAWWRGGGPSLACG